MSPTKDKLNEYCCHKHLDIKGNHPTITNDFQFPCEMVKVKKLAKVNKHDCVFNCDNFDPNALTDPDDEAFYEEQCDFTMVVMTQVL